MNQPSVSFNYKSPRKFTFEIWKTWNKKNKVFETAHQKQHFSCTNTTLLLLCSLVLQQCIALYLLSDGSRVNRLWLGWVLSFSILWALCRHISWPISLMLSKCYQWHLNAVIICCVWFLNDIWQVFTASLNHACKSNVSGPKWNICSGFVSEFQHLLCSCLHVF